MTSDRSADLVHRLDTHFATLVRRRRGHWQAYAAVTGSALAMATSASAGSIIYAGGPITASVQSVVGQSARVSNFQTIALKNATGAAIGKSFRLGIDQANFDSLGGTVSAAGMGGVHFLHVPWNHGFNTSTGGNFPAALPVKKLAFGAEISSKAGKFGGSFFGASGFVASQRPLRGGFSGWPKSSQGFAGFSFTTGEGAADYGWVRLEYTLGQNNLNNSITAYAWAYETGGDPITAGELPAGAPEPSTFALALLAAGAVGIAALRRRRCMTPI